MTTEYRSHFVHYERPLQRIKHIIKVILYKQGRPITDHVKFERYFTRYDKVRWTTCPEETYKSLQNFMKHFKYTESEWNECSYQYIVFALEYEKNHAKELADLRRER